MEDERRHISDGIYRIRRGISRILDDDFDTYPSERYTDHETDYYGEPINRPRDPEFHPVIRSRLDPNSREV